jgi:exodeoxyribonuclease VII small subunit
VQSNPTQLNDLSFEESFVQMQTIISQLENGDIPLAEAITTFEQGMRLAQHCNTLLDQAQLQIQSLEENNDGSFTLTEIDIETE